MPFLRKNIKPIFKSKTSSSSNFKETENASRKNNSRLLKKPGNKKK
jgi:hypothetical protein